MTYLFSLLADRISIVIPRGSGLCLVLEIIRESWWSPFARFAHPESQRPCSLALGHHRLALRPVHVLVSVSFLLLYFMTCPT